MVAVGRYELVHISTDATTTSRLQKADTHNEMYFFLLYDYTGLMGELNAFALTERMVASIYPGRRCAMPWADGCKPFRLLLFV